MSIKIFCTFKINNSMKILVGVLKSWFFLKHTLNIFPIITLNYIIF